MQTVVLYGDKEDKTLKNMIIKEIATDFCVIYYNGDKLLSSGDGEKILLIESDNINEIETECIIILKNNLKTEKIKNLNENSIVIINSGNKSHIEWMSGLDAGVITCGMLAKDTMTFSSISENSAVISLQRSLPLKNTVIEPFEMPVTKHKDFDEYSMLSIAILKLIISNL